MSYPRRTHSAGDLRLEHLGQTVTLNGWVHRIRDLGGVWFADIRDRGGMVQVSADPEKWPQLDLRHEACVAITGVVRARDEKNRNPKIPTGDVEIELTAYDVLGPAGTLPFPVSDEAQMERVNEELRVKYRYLDLRRPSMYRRLAIRASAIRRMRQFLDARGFLEIETPIITKSTPEGARDYLVPYRLEPGQFYALPQSPQQYKQLLMVAGVERYYQIAKCFRDESQRADRQPEFTQLDLEMSFIEQEDIVNLIEALTREVINGLIEEFELDKEPVAEFVRLTYDEAMEKYGSDKPDLRFDLPLLTVSDLVKDSEFAVFKNAVADGGAVRCFRYPGGAKLSRKEVTALEDHVKEFGAKGLAWFALDAAASEASRELPGGLHVRGGIGKFLGDDEVLALVQATGAETGDLLTFIADDYRASCEPLNRLRLMVAEQLGLRDKRKLAFGWVLDFPLVEWNADEQRWDPSHHPFTSPKAADMEFLESDPARVRADCYDVVVNGTEWASGSIRINKPDIQSRIFSLIGVDEETQRSRFGHMLDAFSMGAPPHGGIAPGIDRMVMFLTDDENIREVMAFPKLGQGYDPMMDAPSPIDATQWADLGLTPPKHPE